MQRNSSATVDDTKEEHTGRSLPQLEEAKWPVAEATEGGARLYLVLLSLVSELGVSDVTSLFSGQEANVTS